jgi:hypothetical protein
MRLSSLCFLLALAAPAVSAAEPGDPAPPRARNTYTETLQAWSQANVDTDGWLMVGSTSQGGNGIAWYLADQSAPGSKYPLMQEWVRGENASHVGSILARWEIDCEQVRSREVERVFYAGNNLHGTATVVPAGDAGKWTNPPRASIGETIIQRVCRDAR